MQDEVEQKEEVKKALAAGVPKETILTYFYPEVSFSGTSINDYNFHACILQLPIVKHILFYIGTVYHISCAYAISFNASSDMNSSSPCRMK